MNDIPTTIVIVALIAVIAFMFYHFYKRTTYLGEKLDNNHAYTQDLLNRMNSVRMEKMHIKARLEMAEQDRQYLIEQLKHYEDNERQT